MNRFPDLPVTALLQAASDGDEHALEQLFTRVYDELAHLARRVRGGRASDTLNTTALVHEAFIKLAPSMDGEWQGRAHFFAVAARAMRQILVDAARRQLAQKRGGSRRWLVTFDNDAHAAPVRPDELLALDDALQRLASIDPRRARVVEHRFFAGMSTRETALLLGVSTGTVERDWRAARAWLSTQIVEDPQ